MNGMLTIEFAVLALFDAVGSLKKKETKYFAAYREDLLERIVPSVSVKIKSVR